MKIALINDKYIHHEGGGAQESVRILAETLAARGHRVSVWATTYAPGQARRTEVHNEVRVTFLPVKNVYDPHVKRPGLLKPLWHAIDSYNPLMAREVAGLIDAERPDVLHTNILAGFSPAVWAAAAQKGVPVVHTLRDYYLRCPRGSMFKKENSCPAPCAGCRLYSLPKQAAAHGLAALVGISRHLLEEHRSIGGADLLRRVIHNSYAANGTLPAPAPGSHLRVGYLGRLCPTKGIELLMESIRDAARTQLFIAGKGEAGYEAELRQRANPRMTFLGVVPPRELFKRIDVLVAPSLWHEPFGRIAIEALAWGVPVIASRRGGLPEILEHGGTGFLFEPNEPGSLAWVLRGLTPEACAAMRTACLRRALDFLPEAMTGQYEELYREVVSRAAQPARRPTATRREEETPVAMAAAGAAGTTRGSCPASLAGG